MWDLEKKNKTRLHESLTVDLVNPVCGVDPVIRGDAGPEVSHVNGLAAPVAVDVEEDLDLVKVGVAVELGHDGGGEAGDQTVELVGPLACGKSRSSTRATLVIFAFKFSLGTLLHLTVDLVLQRILHSNCDLMKMHSFFK